MADEREHAVKRLARHFWAPVPWMLEATIALQIVSRERHRSANDQRPVDFQRRPQRIPGEPRLQPRSNSSNSGCRSERRSSATVSGSKLPAAVLVPGDVVQLSLGVLVPGDVRIIEGSVLLDQSMITGESMPVEAGPGETAYAGALVRRGEAIALVTGTGASTYYGRAAELVRIAHVESSEIKVVLSLVRNLSIINAVLLVGLVAYADAIGMRTRPDHPAGTDSAALRGAGCTAGHIYFGRGARREDDRAQRCAVDAACPRCTRRR